MSKITNDCWMVQYNLTGLSAPIRLIWNTETNAYWDETENFGGNKNLNPIDRRDFVAHFFRSLEEATAFYNALNRYRRFIKSHL